MTNEKQPHYHVKIYVR